MKPHFELRRVRDFGETISDTFTFIRENFKALIKPLLVICGFFILINTITLANLYAGMTEAKMQETSRPSNVFASQYGDNYFINLLINYTSLFLFATSIFIVTYCYIAVYKDKTDGEKPTLVEVWGYFKYYFFRSIGSYFVVTLLSIAGCFLCLLPGIYLFVVFGLILPIIIMENGSFGHAFNKCFQLIKGNWWMTFGIIFVLSLIISFSGAIVSVPMGIVIAAKTLLQLDFLMYPILLVLSLLLSLIYLSYSLMAIAMSLCYFSFEEQKEGTGILSRINTLGEKGPDTTHQPEEEY